MRADCSLHVFVATPRDVAAERDRLGLIVRDLSAAFAEHGLTLELLDWRDVVPDLGRPEDVIVDQLPVKKWDIFIGVLWARFGTPPGRKDPETGKPFLSGTEEEFTLACRSWRETSKPCILFYRCKRPVPVDWLDPKQIALVQQFFTGFEAGGEYPGLYQEYETVDDFERRVRQDLLKLLLEYSRGEKQAVLESEVGERVRKLEEEQKAQEEAEEEPQPPPPSATPQLKLPADPDTLYTKALELFYIGQYAEAVPLLEAVLKAQPDYPGAKEKLEIVRLVDELPRLRKAGNWRGTLKKVARLRELGLDYADPEGHAVWAEERRWVNEVYQQGIQAMDAKEWTEAIRAFQQIVEIDPQYRRAQALLERARADYCRPLEKWRGLRLIGKHEAPVSSVAFSPDGSLLASGCHDSIVRLWEVATGGQVLRLEWHRNTVSCVAFSPDGGLLASGSYDKTVRLWEMPTGRQVHILEGHRDPVHSVAFSPDGSLLASSSGPPFGAGDTRGSDTTVRLWEVAMGQQVRILKEHMDAVYSVAFSPVGSLLASSSGSTFSDGDTTVRLWEVAEGRQVHVLTGHRDAVHSVAFSPDGSLLASSSGSFYGGGDATVRLWEVATKRQVLVLERIKSTVYSVAFSPDGLLLASGGDDNTVRLWEVQTGRQVRILEEHTDPVLSVNFSPDGLLLVSSSEDGTVRLWGAG